MDDDWEAEEPGADVTRDSVEETGIQQQYLRGVHDRLKLELSGKLPALQSKWLLEHLKINDWWVRKEQAILVIHKLKLSKPHPCHKVYYHSIKVWLPEERWKGC